MILYDVGFQLINFYISSIQSVRKITSFACFVFIGLAFYSTSASVYSIETRVDQGNLEAKQSTSDKGALPVQSKLKKTASSCPDFLNRDFPRLHSSKTLNPCQLGEHKAILVVNTASHCGFTPQFKGLEAIHQVYKDKGLLVLGFPSDDFFQEADSESETAEVCYKNYGVTFPMFKAVKVRGKKADPVFAAIAEQGSKPKWNFYKFLLGPDGHLIQSFSSRTKPNNTKFLKTIDQALGI